MSENAGGVLVQSQVQKEQPNKWDDIGTLDKNYDGLFPNVDIEDFNQMRFRIRGYSKGTPIIIKGIELLKLSDEGYDQN